MCEVTDSSLKPIIVYPGRFQPMLPHHAEVYNKLQSIYPDADVYIGTSDKVEPGKSPFNFEEKKTIMEQLYGIPSDRVLNVSQPYNGDQYAPFFDTSAVYLMLAVGKKDMEGSARFAFNDIDPATGYNMKKRKPEPTYLQSGAMMDKEIRPMSEMAYIIVAPTIVTNGEIASASAFRAELSNSPDPQETLRQKFGNKVEPIADLLISKIVG